MLAVLELAIVDVNPDIVLKTLNKIDEHGVVVSINMFQEMFIDENAFKDNRLAIAVVWFALSSRGFKL